MPGSEGAGTYENKSLARIDRCVSCLGFHLPGNPLRGGKHPAALSGGLRFLISGLILYIWRRSQGDPAPTKVQWRAAAIIGLFLLLGGNGGLVWAEQYIPSGISSLFIATTPLWMVLIDSFRPGGKSPGWLTWFGVLLGLAGIVC